MTPAKIQYELKKRKITQKSIADQEEVHPISVSKVINRLIISDRLMRAVSEKIDRDHRAVFSEYYLKPPKRSTSKVAPVG
ncbi:MAG: hypothetical protein JRD05_00555 [Deltaproteobacteria bacterium]|nr:hypothetical protein [Deltaproteobacteria bacterium]